MPRKQLLALAIAQAATLGAAHAATITVDSTADSSADDGSCTLREAIENANNDSQNGRTSAGECAAGSGSDSIDFAPATFASAQTITLAGGEMAISSPLTITGPGEALLTIDANAASRHFTIDDGGMATALPVAVSDLTLRNGRVVGAPGGGAIRNRESLQLSRMTLSGNTVVNSGTSPSRGGALAVDPPDGSAGLDIQLDQVTISGNTGGDGGGMNLHLFATTPGSSVTLANCHVDNNHAATMGGVIAASSGAGRINIGSGSLLIQDSTFSSNQSDSSDGGLSVYGGAGSHIRLDRVDVLNNTAGAGRERGGLGIYLGNEGGAAFDFALRDSTVAGNSAARYGGMLLSASGTGQAVIERSTISGNSALTGRVGGVSLSAYESDVTLRDSTVSGNSAAGNAGGVYAYAYGEYGTGRVIIEGSTIVGNVADSDGNDSGGGGGLGLNSSSNENGQFLVRNSVIAGNSDHATTAPSPDVFPQDRTIAFSDSLIGDATGAGLTEAPLGSPDADNNLIGDAAGGGVIDAKLGALSDNGGATLTHLPQLGSPLIDAFDGCSGNDQRGEPRGSDGDASASASECDIGAVEFQHVVDFAVDDSVSASQGVDVTFNVLANETDPDDDYTATFSVVAVNGVAGNIGVDIAVAGGIFNISSNGSATFTPTDDSAGEGESYQSAIAYTVSDGLGTDTATATVTVNGVNDAPFAGTGSASTIEDSPITDALPAGDVDGDPLTATLVTAPSAGTVSLDSANLQFTFDPAGAFESLKDGESQDVSFQFKVNDGSLDSGVGTVTVTVTGVNDAPFAGTGSASTSEDLPITDALPAGDVDGDALTATLLTAASAGTVSLDSDNLQFIFDPAGAFESLKEGESQDVSFQFKVNDGSLDSGIGTVTVTVTGVNDAPVAGADHYQVVAGQTLSVPAGEGMLANDSDVDDDSLAVAAGTFAAGGVGGTLALAADGSFEYTAPATTGSATFDYTLTDGHVNVTGNLTIDVLSATSLDLEISKSNGVSSVAANDVLTYTINVVNNGPVDAVDARVQDTLPADLRNASWTCEAVPPSADTACANASGSGDIDEWVNIAVGDAVVFELMATMAERPGGSTLSNTATVTAPDGYTDSVPGNNNATDVDETDLRFRDGFESIVLAKRFGARTMTLTQNEVVQRLPPDAGHRPVLIARAQSSEGMVLVHARHNAGGIELRISRFEQREWTQGPWSALRRERVELQW